MIDSLIQWVAQWLAYITTELVKWVQGVIQGIRAYFDDILHTFFTYISEVFHFIGSKIAEFVMSIKNALAGVIDSIVATLKGVLNKILTVTVNVVDTIAGYVRDILSKVKTAIASAIDYIADGVRSVLNALQGAVNSVIRSVADLVRSVRDTIVGTLEYIFNIIQSAYNETLQRLNVGIQTLIGGAGSLVESIGVRLGNLREAFGLAATDLSAAIAGMGKEQLAPIRETLDDFFSSIVEFIDPRETQNVTAAMQRITGGQASPAEMRAFISSEWARYVPESRLWTGFFSIVGSIIGILMTFLSIGQAQAQVLLQDYVKEFPYQVLNPADVTTAWRRGLIDEGKAIDTIQRQGYDQATAKVILRLSDVVPMEQDLFTLWHRGLIKETSLDDALFLKGYSSEYTHALKKASFLIPPAGDLILMAVREVFSPEVAAKFGQYEDFPAEFAEWAEKQGLTQEWAERYWAAHWALPSAQQGFEMLHRGVIDKGELNLLLRALDVMPFWRDRLTQVAYRPFTRVDVRRMHKLGILDDAAVKRSYMDLGYDDEKATRMTEFTIAYNAPKKADDDVELGQLTRASVVNFYADGLLTQSKAHELLIGLGYSSEGATLYLEAADLDNERKERKSEIDLVLDLAKANIIDFQTAQDRLHALELSTIEIQRALAELERNEARKTKLPSRSEAERMVLAGLIPLDDYRRLLSTLGYSPMWVNAFVNLLGGEFIGGQKRS